ncbi:MAG: hypothetical protein A2Y15_06885 [Clostridiales bacterium GWF2_36_10]|nr:MAG: hypothetical protein A2Y15_06885 [Clostridiales bacterium GWF2_36_10]HAN21936.1 hypothetical protein [Clostridiales bacterium]
MLLEANILVYIKSKFLYNRIENLFFQDKAINFLESTSIADCLLKIENLSTNLSCVIIDDECEEREAIIGMSCIHKVSRKKIPILLISSGKKVSFFNEAINQGISDIIIKPFADDFFRERVLKLISKNKNRNVENISISLFKYLSGELRKAEKGNFPLTLMFTTIQFIDEKKYSHEQKVFFLDSYYNVQKNLFWDTDLFIKFDTKYYLGVFPFCDSKNAQSIYKKNVENFEVLKRTNIIPAESKLIVSFVSYPDNIDTIANGFLTLMKDIKEDSSDSEMEIYFNEYGEIKL